MRLRSADRRIRPCEQLREGVPGRHIDPECQFVHEETDERPRSLVVAPRDHEPKDDRVALGVAVEQGLDRRQEEDGDGRALGGSQGLQLRPHTRREAKGLAQPLESGHGGSRQVEWQLQRQRVRTEVLLPVGALLLEHPRPLRGALPDGVVDEVEREGRDAGARFPHARAIPVERGELPHEDVAGPGVEHEVVDGEEQDVPVVLHPDQPRPEQGVPLEVHRGTDFRPRKPLDLRQGIRVGAKVQQRQGDGRGGSDDLHRYPVARAKGGTEASVASHDHAQGGRQGVRVQRPVERDARHGAVRRHPRVELLQEPEPFLCAGQRVLVPRRVAPDGKEAPGSRSTHGPFDHHREFVEDRRPEHVLEPELDSHGGADAREHLDHLDRRTAQLEEVVQPVDGATAEDLAPHERELALRVGPVG